MAFLDQSEEQPLDPYSMGKTLTLTLDDPQDVDGTIVYTCEAKIEHAFTNFLDACVMRVTLTPSPWGSGPVILKLFNIANEPKFYHNEVEAYGRLHHLQGTSVPKLLATISATHAHHEGFEPPGILLEFVPGFGLDECFSSAFGLNAVPSVSERIHLAQTSVNLVGEMLTAGVSHNDLHEGNLRFRLNQDTGKYDPVVIDFERACCSEGDDDLQWKKIAAEAHEEERLFSYLAQGFYLPPDCLKLSPQFLAIMKAVRSAKASLARKFLIIIRLTLGFPRR